MRTPRRILVPVDFTPCCTAALEYAAMLGSALAAEVHVLHVLPAPLDRKSTRLNSSHITNSYAVFCLKKKNPPATYTRKVRRIYTRSPPARTAALL